MRSRLVVSVTLVATAISLCVSYGVHALRAAGPPAADPLAELALTPAQQARVRAQFERDHPLLVELQERAHAERARLAELLARPQPPPAEIAACLDGIARLESELDSRVVASLLALKPHLSPEQQQRLFHFIELHHAAEAQTRQER